MPARLRRTPVQESSRPMPAPRRHYRTKSFDTWDAFKNGIRDVLPGVHDYDVYKRFIFRGQGNADWPLKSTFDRSYSDKQAASRDAWRKS